METDDPPGGWMKTRRNAIAFRVKPEARMSTKNATMKTDAWKSDAERLAFGLFASKPRKDIVVVDLIQESARLGIDHEVFFDGFSELKTRGALKVLFGGRHATTAAICEYDDDVFEPVYGGKDVLSALAAFLAVSPMEPQGNGRPVE
jgi:hypothetical protein